MPQFYAYKTGYTTGHSFSLTSSWTPSSYPNPSIGTATHSYSLSQLPSSATNVEVTVYAQLAKDLSPYGGIASGYPTANGESFTLVSGDLYKATISFSDISATTSITYKYKARGDSTHKQGALTFDDVYLLVEYDMPSASWALNTSTVTPGGYVTGTVQITDTNKDYLHYFYVDFSGSNDSGPPYVLISKDTAQTITFSIQIPNNWADVIASYTNGATAYVYYQMQDAQGSVISTSSAQTITLTVTDAAPRPGTLHITRGNQYNNMLVQNYSTLQQQLSGFDGDKYGSSVTSVRITDSNGQSKTVSYPSSSVVWDYGVVRSSGTYTFTATVTDNKNHSASTSASVYVQAYTPVSITSARIGRYDATTGQADVSEGEGAYAIVNYTYTNLGGNTPSLIVDYRSTSVQGVKSYQSYSSGTQWAFVNNGIIKEEVFTVDLTISDGLSSTSVQRKLGTAAVYIRQDPKNNAIGFGCYPTLPSASSDKLGCFEISPDWDFRVGGESITDLIANSSSSKIIVSATRPTNPEPGTIWLDIS